MAHQAVSAQGRAVFSKQQLEELFAQLKRDWGYVPEWEKILRDAHLGVARADAGAPLGDIDPRVVAMIERYLQAP